MRHLSGPTSPLSTQANGAEKWIALLPDSHAKTSASQADAPGLTANAAASFLKSPALPAIAVRHTSFWRTSQASLLPPPPLWTKPKANSTNAQPPASWENWPTSGGTRNGSLYPRPTWAPATAAPAGSAGPGAWTRWDTPDSMPEAPNTGSNRTAQPAGLGNQARIATNWATPDCNTSTYSNGQMGPNIREQASHWTTPDQCLGAIAETVTSSTWPTPAARDGKGANSEEHALITGGGRKHMVQPANFVAHTPLDYLPPAPVAQPGTESSPPNPTERRRLNPLFASWLMGWPLTWTIADPSASSASATALWRSALQQHLSCLFDEPANPLTEEQTSP